MTITQVKQAKQAALAHVNKDRAAANLPPLKQVTAQWWRLYGSEWLAKQKEAK